uniref:Uncharacterized protein n=1 Tax=Rhizophora mucronata TaxID=61149 RepID=A0A2P2NDF8_RHIMU
MKMTQFGGQALIAQLYCHPKHKELPSQSWHKCVHLHMQHPLQRLH